MVYFQKNNFSPELHDFIMYKLMVLWPQVWDLPSILQWWKQALVMTAKIIKYHQACWEHSVNEFTYAWTLWIDAIWSSFLCLLIMKKSRKHTQKVHRPITWIRFLAVTEATYWGKWVMTDSVLTLQRSCDDWNSKSQVGHVAGAGEH